MRGEQDGASAYMESPQKDRGGGVSSTLRGGGLPFAPRHVAKIFVANYGESMRPGGGFETGENIPEGRAPFD